MEKDLIVFESAQWLLSEAAQQVLSSKGKVQKKICSFGGSEIRNFLGSFQFPNVHGIFIPAAMVQDAQLLQVLQTYTFRNQIIIVESKEFSAKSIPAVRIFTRVRDEDLTDSPLLDRLFLATAPQRGPGIKAFLPKGATIFSENIFRAEALGNKLDPSFFLAMNVLGETRAMQVWSILNLAVLHGLVSLNQYGTDDSNKRVKIQIGTTGNKLVLCVSYPVTSETMKDLYYGLQDIYTSNQDNRWLASWRQANYLEVSHYSVSKRGELIACFEKNPASSYLPFVVREVHTNDLEAGDDAKYYNYKLFSAVKEALETGDTKIVTGAKPKQKLSERMAALKAKHSGASTGSATAPTATTSPGVKIIKGEAPAPVEKTVIENTTQHINNEGVLDVKSLEQPAAETAVESGTESTAAGEEDLLSAISKVAEDIESEDAATESVATPAATAEASTSDVQAEAKVIENLFSLDAPRAERDPAKLLALFESRLSAAQEIIKLRDQTIQNLSKRIDDVLSDKKDAITNVIDAQREGLKQNVARLEGEMALAIKREKEILADLSKAVQARDEAVRQLKAGENKAVGDDNALVAKLQELEKALETEKQQKAELMKRLVSGTAKKVA